MPTLSRDHRRLLENTVAQARTIAVDGARKVLTDQYAVHHHEPWPHMTSEERELRNQLRAHGRQLGDRRDERRDTQEIDHLVQACAYEHWHRMLFARFLAENDLLLDADHGMAMSLDEVRELAREQNRDWLEIAAELAQKMLLAVFRPDDPVLRVSLPPETRQELEEKLETLPASVFQADDSLGWVYQFWQRDEKDRVNKSEVKIGADELPAVTQLFTEDYMVLFLLENTLGSWWTAKRRAEGKDPALPGYEWTYLRLNEDGSPAAGSFETWPRAARELRVLDPSMGSGHFLVFALPILARMRVQEDELTLKEALATVLSENLFGLEIDARCAQIAAFNLALAAWRLAGEHFALPPLNLACSGLGIHASEADWISLGGDNAPAREEMRRIYSLVKDAPILGSLIDPLRLRATVYSAGVESVVPLIEAALGQEPSFDVRELAIAAKGVLAAFRILSSSFTLVATNVPYLGRHKQDEVLKAYCEEFHTDARADLATCFVDRALRFCGKFGSVALLTPHSWLHQDRYKDVRLRLLRTKQWHFAVRLGPRAFSTISGEVVNVSLVAIGAGQTKVSDSFLLDVSVSDSPEEKKSALLREKIIPLQQSRQLGNPDGRIVFGALEDETERLPLLNTMAECYQGLRTGDANRFIRCFWELVDIGDRWEYFQSSSDDTGSAITGLSYAILWENGRGALARYAAETRDKLHDMHESGNRCWGKPGVAIGQMTLRATRYFGHKYDNTLAVVAPLRDRDLPAVLTYLRSDQYREQVREIAHGMYITNQTLVKVPIDVTYWRGLADESNEDGLPTPHSTDPTQWIFTGHPFGADHPLQVAVARLVGYAWPRLAGSSFPESAAIALDGLEKFADSDGIVGLSSVSGEAPAAERLRGLLAEAYGSDWSAPRLSELIGGCESLEVWLRDKFFEEHCQVFHQRPFIWHVWDGRKDGFHALVNYHKLVAPNGEGHKTLEKLIYTTLGDWINRQRSEVNTGVEGADARLAAASHLKTELERILRGDSPYDIFVRWKSLSEQPIGWEPSIDDGVRLNIRPWLAAALAPSTRPKKGSCILRVTPKISLGKDRGKEPHRPKEDFPWFWSWDEQSENFLGGKDFDGARWNDLHYSLDLKRKARELRKQMGTKA